MKQELKIVNVPIDELKFSEYNPRKAGEKNWLLELEKNQCSKCKTIYALLQEGIYLMEEHFGKQVIIRWDKKNKMSESPRFIWEKWKLTNKKAKLLE